MKSDNYPKVIGLHGHAGVGKSLAAAYLQEAHGYTLLKFAGPLKHMARAIGLSHDHIEGPLKELPTPLLDGKSPREFMQLLGTEFGRHHLGEDFWVNRAMDNVHRILDVGGRVVLDDVRFLNEASAVHDIGGVVIEIERPGVGPVNSHSSDNIAVPSDVFILNGGSKLDLIEALDFTLAKLRGEFAEAA